jgi:hypothetical protein
VLKPQEKKYLASELNGNKFYLNDKLKGKEVKIHINITDAPGLPDVKLVDDVDRLNVSRVSEFPMIRIEVFDGKIRENTTLDVNVNSRYSSLSHDFLRFAKAHGYAVTNSDTYVFDLTNWDYAKPIFVLPMVHFSMSSHQSEIAKMLESTAVEMEKRSNVVSPQAFIVEFHDLVNRRLQVNLSVLEIIAYSSMVVDATAGNYDLPKPWTTGGMGVLKMLLENRSISAHMGYQGHRSCFMDPASYIHTNRMDHIFDAAILPQEVLQGVGNL